MTTIVHLASDVLLAVILVLVLLMNHRVLKLNHRVLLLNQQLLTMVEAFLQVKAHDDESPVHRVS